MIERVDLDQLTTTATKLINELDTYDDKELKNVIKGLIQHTTNAVIQIYKLQDAMEQLGIHLRDHKPEPKEPQEGLYK